MQRNHMRRTGRSTVHGDEGLTLVEIIVAISLLGIFAITFAPILYTNLDVSLRQTTIAYASQQAASYIDDARASGANTCSSLNSWASQHRTTSLDGKSVTVKVSGEVTSGCGPHTSGPRTATFTVTSCVPRVGIPSADPCAAGDRILATVVTRILVLS